MELLNYFKALSDQTRLRLLNILIHCELNVNELVTVLRMSQPRISRHLKILLDSGLISYRRDGLWTFYSAVNNGNSRHYIDAIKPLLNSALEFKADIDSCDKIIQDRSAETTRFFNKVAGDWGKLKQNIIGNFDINKILAQYMNKCGLAVDIGCGTGDLIPALLANADNVIGVDRSQKMLEHAKKLLSAYADRLSLRLGDLEHLPLSDNEADFAVANMVLHHLSSPMEAINEIHRVVKKTGSFVIIDLLKHSNEQMRTKYGDRWLGFEKEEIKKWLIKTKFLVKNSVMYDIQNELKIIFISAVKQ
ncbi:MAG: metalloregulator ArsR/SmtB family transcription factor [Spirochaetes bacterium]|nr:metalloregulator ArsR/SmtB family transcription factor [Spirochaetota bacterium]